MGGWAWWVPPAQALHGIASVGRQLFYITHHNTHQTTPPKRTQDGRLAAEFDVTPFVHATPGKANLLAVRVLRWSDGAWRVGIVMVVDGGARRSVPMHSPAIVHPSPLTPPTPLLPHTTTQHTGSYLEDQDHWRLSGLERDVELVYVEGLGPAGHVIRDYTCVWVLVWGG